MPRNGQTHRRPATDAATHERAENHAVIAVYGLACRGCAWRLQRKLSRADGVTECVTNPFAETVSVTFDSAKLDTERLLELIRGTGLEPRLARMTIPVPDLLHAPSASRRVVSAIQAIGGAAGAAASSLSGGIVVEYDAGRVDRESVMRVVRASGLEAGAPVLHSETLASAKRHGGLAAIFAALFAILAALLALSRNVDVTLPATEWLAPAASLPARNAAAAALAFAIASVACAAPLVRRGFRRLFRGKVDENSLVAAGLVALLVAAAVAAFVGGDPVPLAATAATSAAVLLRRWLTVRRVAQPMPADGDARHPFRSDAFALRPPESLQAALGQSRVVVAMMVAFTVAGAAVVWLTRGSAVDAVITALAALVGGFAGSLAAGTERLFADALQALNARGICVADARTLERAAALRNVLADEETFFRAVPEITDYVLLRGESQGGLLRRAAVAFEGSPHPIAVAIRSKAGSTAEETPFVLESADPGRGVTGKVGRRDLVAGIPEYLAAHGVDLSDAADEIARFSSERKRTVGVALSGRLDGVIALMEPLREGSRTAVESLRGAAVDVAYATTDDESLANAHVAPLALTRTTILRDRRQRVDVARRMRGESATALVMGRESEAAMLRAGDLGIAIGESPSLLAAGDVVIPAASPVAIAQFVTEAKAVVARASSTRRRWLPFQTAALAAPLAAGAFGGAAFAPVAAAGLALAGAIVTLHASRHKA